MTMLNIYHVTVVLNGNRCILLEHCSRYKPSSAVQTMTDDKEDNIERVKKENERLIIKFFGLEKFFQEHPDEN